MRARPEDIPNSVELVVEGDGPSRSGARGAAFSPQFRYIDERRLPDELVFQETRSWEQVVDAVKSLAVRGAPAIGIAGAAAIALWAADEGDARTLDEVAESVASARPTAVNLRWGVERARAAAKAQATRQCQAHSLYELVRAMQEEDEAANRAIGRAGAALLAPRSRILTHCNAGSLATFHYGTALGVVYAAADQGKVSRVYADETRPVGQGSRLTAWELARAGVPVTLICDDMAASLMAQGEVDAVVVGADRIARNGDAANKIGTYGLAVLAAAHGVPFYVAAPTSTIDASLPDGSGIVIEQRAAEEVLPRPIDGVDVWNPAFDVTPSRYITKIVTERGAFAPADLEAQLLRGSVAKIVT